MSNLWPGWALFASLFDEKGGHWKGEGIIFLKSNSVGLIPSGPRVPRLGDCLKHRFKERFGSLLICADLEMSIVMLV